MTRPAAVLFDCDGVIVDSERPTFDLILADLATRGLRLTLEEFETDYIGGTIETIGARACAAEGSRRRCCSWPNHLRNMSSVSMHA